VTKDQNCFYETFLFNGNFLPFLHIEDKKKNNEKIQIVHCSYRISKNEKTDRKSDNHNVTID